MYSDWKTSDGILKDNSPFSFKKSFRLFDKNDSEKKFSISGLFNPIFELGLFDPFIFKASAEDMSIKLFISIVDSNKFTVKKENKKINKKTYKKKRYYKKTK